MALRAVVVSEDPLAGGGLVTLLEREDVQVVARLSPSEATPEVLDASGADALAVDVGGEATLEVLRAAPIPAVALVADEPQASEALSSGSRGVVLRGAPARRIAAALAAVASGLSAIDAALAPELIRPLPAHAAGDFTAREAEVLALLAEGLSNKAIASRLGVAERTAKFHVESILAKLGAGSRAEAIVKAARLGLVTL